MRQSSKLTVSTRVYALAAVKSEENVAPMGKKDRENNIISSLE